MFSVLISAYFGLILLPGALPAADQAERDITISLPETAYPDLISISYPGLGWPSNRKISRTEITWAQYLQSVDDGTCAVPISVRGQSYTLAKLPRDDFPVTGISLVDANCYAGWLSQRLGRKFRVPTSEEYDELLMITGVTTFDEYLELMEQQELPVHDPRLPIGNLQVNLSPRDVLGLQGLSDNALELTTTVIAGTGTECFPQQFPCQRVAIRGRFPGVPIGDRDPVEGTLFYTSLTGTEAGAGFRIVED